MEGLIEGGEISVGEGAREMGWRVLRPRIRRVPRIAFAQMEVITAGLLPPRLRDEYGLAWGRAQRVAFSTFRVGLAGLVALAPVPIRWLPHARHAYRRFELPPAPGLEGEWGGGRGLKPPRRWRPTAFPGPHP